MRYSLALLAMLVASAVCAEEVSHSDVQLEASGDIEDDSDIEFVTVPEADRPTHEGDVVLLYDNTFDEALRNHSTMLIMFSANWCGQCRAINKEISKAATIAKELNLPFVIAKVNAPDEEELKERFDVKSVPTFKLVFINETARSFPFLTTGEAIVSGVSKMLGLSTYISPIKMWEDSLEDLLSWLFWRGTNDGRIITTLALYDSAPQDSTEYAPLRDLFRHAADELQRFHSLRFVTIRDPSIVEALMGENAKPTIVMYTDHDEGRFVYDGALDITNFTEFVVRHDTPLVATVWHKTLQTFRRRVPLFALYFVSEGQYSDMLTMGRIREGLRNATNILLEEGTIRRGEFSLGIADGNKYKSWMQPFKLPTGRFPAMSIESTQLSVGAAAPDFADEVCTLPDPDPTTELYLEELAMLEAGTRDFQRPMTEIPLLAPHCSEGQQEARKAHIAAMKGRFKQMQREQRQQTMAVGADGSQSQEPVDEDKDDKVPKIPLHWTAVPVDAVVSFVRDYVKGTLPEQLKVKISAPSKPTPKPNPLMNAVH